MPPPRRMRLWPQPQSVRIKPEMIITGCPYVFLPAKLQYWNSSSVDGFVEEYAPWLEFSFELFEVNPIRYRSTPSPQQCVIEARMETIVQGPPDLFDAFVGVWLAAYDAKGVKRWESNEPFPWKFENQELFQIPMVIDEFTGQYFQEEETPKGRDPGAAIRLMPENWSFPNEARP